MCVLNYTTNLVQCGHKLHVSTLFFIKILTKSRSTHTISISIGVGSPSSSHSCAAGRRFCNSSVNDQLLLLLLSSYNILVPVASNIYSSEWRDAVNIHPYPWDIHDAWSELAACSCMFAREPQCGDSRSSSFVGKRLGRASLQAKP